MPTWTVQNYTHHTLHHRVMEYHEWKFHKRYGPTFVWHFSLRGESVEWVFEAFFLLGGRRPRFRQPSASARPRWTNWRMEAGFCRGSVSPESDVLSTGKWTKCYDWSISLKCKNQIGCGTTARKCPLLTDSLAIPGHTYAYAWKWLFYLHFFAWWFPFWHISIIQFTLVW